MIEHVIFTPEADDDVAGPTIRFPFEIFYELTVDSITIYSVFHCSQDPQKWRKRLGY
jgi:hypothetical protein